MAPSVSLWLFFSVWRLVLGFARGALVPQELVVTMFDNSLADKSHRSEVQAAFEAAYKHFNDTFDYSALDHAASEFQKGAVRYKQSDAYIGYRSLPTVPHCDYGVLGPPAHIRGVSPFPGGVVKQVFGSDFTSQIMELAQSASGPASAGLVPVAALTSENLKLGMGMVQAVVASLVHNVPPLIPPPVWNNQPLPCAPMVTGHNCFGAVLYPITMADFVLADVTDSMLDGVVAGFPNTYATKVGKTSDEMYRACFASYMSMQCSSIFPRCTAPQSRDEPMPIGGRVPMCLHLCIMPLVMCPGFWVEDIIGTCSMVSVPPMCTQAFFSNLWRLPPQYTDFDDSQPFPRECPKNDVSSSRDPMSKAALYSSGPVLRSPILMNASASKGQGFQ